MSRIVPPNPANTSTPAFSTVSSPGGFQSGDLVYFRDSSFGTIPNNAVTSANFPVTATVSQNRMAFNPTVGWANYNPNAQTGSTNSRAPSVALLTNGNIAVVFVENSGGNGAACFKIINQNGAVVVDRTPLVSNGVNGLIGVCALTGGGFAVAVRNASNSQIWYGVFSNTGAVVTAMAADSNFGTSISTLETRALSGGGFVIAIATGGTTYGFRTYSATGAGNTYVTNAGWNSDAQIVITTFSDNTFAALYPQGSSVLQVTRFNNTGGIIGTTTVSSDWFNSSGYDFITLNDGSGVILNIDTDGGAYGMWARPYTQSTGAVGSRTRIAGNAGFQVTVNACALSAGGFVAIEAFPSTGVAIMRRYNASFASQSTCTLSGLPGYAANSTTQNGWRMTILEGATFLTIVNNTYTSIAPTYGSMPYMQIDKSNITLTGIRRGFQVSQAVANLPAPVSGYARSASTPNSAAFLSSTTQTLTQSFAASSGTSFVLTPAAFTDSTITNQCMTDMNNGQFVISYRSTNGSTRFTVFDSLGSSVSTTVVAASGSSGISQCTCLGNGKLVVAWTNGSHAFFSIYSENTYTLLATGSTQGSPLNPSGNLASWNSSAGYDIAPFGNDSFVVAYQNGNGGITVSVFNDSGVYQTQASGDNTGGLWNIRVASNATGSVAVKFYSSNNLQGYVSWFSRNTTTNSIFSQQFTSVTSYSGNNYGEGMALSPNGTIFNYASNTSSRFANRQATSGQFTLSYPVGHASNNAGVCVGQYGDFVLLNVDSSGSRWGRVSVNGNLTVYGTSISQTLFTDSQTLTFSNPNTNSNVGSQAQIVNLYDDVYAFSFINGAGSSSGQILVGLLCTNAVTYNTTITAGVTPSNTALVPSPANGYYLAGVSASECAAGGTGVVQINGTATLNSQYPAGTTSQSFDFNTPALDVGVRGTIAGRNMIISGGK